MFCYLTNQQECGCTGGDNGATIAGSVAAAGKEGVCEESLFPYTARRWPPANTLTQSRRPLTAEGKAAPRRLAFGHPRLPDGHSIPRHGRRDSDRHPSRRPVPKLFGSAHGTDGPKGCAKSRRRPCLGGHRVPQAQPRSSNPPAMAALGSSARTPGAATVGVPKASSSSSPPRGTTSAKTFRTAK